MTSSTYQQGYQDGTSCCRKWGESTARRLAGLKHRNQYEQGKEEAAQDWLKDLEKEEERK